MKRKIGFGFLIFIGLLVALYVVFSTRIYPVATVNDAFISARSFQATARAAEHYYGNLLGSAPTLASTTVEEFQSEMRRVALQGLIEDALVTAHLKTLYESAPLELAVTKRVEETVSASGEKMEVAAQELFGLTLSEFKEIVLAPKARLELLSEELEADQIDLAAWLATELQAAQVSITVSDLAWRGGQVELTGEQSYTAKVKEAFGRLASSTQDLQQQAASSTLDQ